jgi:phospholipid N-methyltransferase
MARCLALEGNGHVVELGAGTGSVTRALIDHGIEPCRLIVIERSSVLAEGLRRRFPHIEVIHGDALQLRKLLGARALKVGAIFSSLPLRSLPQHDANSIREEIQAIMRPGSRLIQYSYNLHKPSIPETPDLVRIATYRVWANLPPARVDMYSFVGVKSYTSPAGIVSTG